MLPTPSQKLIDEPSDAGLIKKEDSLVCEAAGSCQDRGTNISTVVRTELDGETHSTPPSSFKHKCPQLFLCRVDLTMMDWVEVATQISRLK